VIATHHAAPCYFTDCLTAAFVLHTHALLSHNRLASWLPPKDSVAYGLLSGYLPVLLLALLMILLPIVISLSASKFMKLKSHSEVDLYVFKWHFGQFTALSASLLVL
jgi:Calcium-dependent channel, 7TM region, putative phosphate